MNAAELIRIMGLDSNKVLDDAENAAAIAQIRKAIDRTKARGVAAEMLFYQTFDRLRRCADGSAGLKVGDQVHTLADGLELLFSRNNPELAEAAESFNAFDDERRRALAAKVPPKPSNPIADMQRLEAWQSLDYVTRARLRFPSREPNAFDMAATIERERAAGRFSAPPDGWVAPAGSNAPPPSAFSSMDTRPRMVEPNDVGYVTVTEERITQRDIALMEKR